MAILYADEDFSYPVVQPLWQLGHDLLTAHEAGQAGQGITDKEVLALAIAAGRAVVTFQRCRRMPASLFALVTTMFWLWPTVFINNFRRFRPCRTSCSESTDLPMYNMRTYYVYITVL
jgi:hypothetical protein